MKNQFLFSLLSISFFMYSHLNAMKEKSSEKANNVQILEGHRDQVHSFCFFSNAKKLLSGSSDHTIKMWDTESGEQVPFKQKTPYTYQLRVAPQGTLLASSYNAGIKLWDINIGKKVKIFAGHTANVKSLCFSSDGKLLASGAIDRTAKIWHIDDKEQVTLTGHKGWVSSVVFSPDDSLLASGSDKTIKIWNLSTKDCLQTLKLPNQVSSVHFSSDGKLLVSSSYGFNNGEVTIWDIAKGECLKTILLPTIVSGAHLLPDEKKLAIIGSYALKILNSTTEEETEIYHSPTKHLYTDCCAPDKTKIAFALYNDNNVYTINLPQ